MVSGKNTEVIMGNKTIPEGFSIISQPQTSVAIPEGFSIVSQPEEEQQLFQDPIERETVPEKVAIGIGRSFVESGQGIKQIGLQIGETLGFVSPQEVEDYRTKIYEEKELYEKGGAGDSTAAGVGEFVGDVAQAVPGGLVAAPAKLGTRVALGAGLGAAEAGVKPVYGEDFGKEKAIQVGTGALIGGGATYTLDKLVEFMPKNMMAKFYQKAQEKVDDVMSEADVLEVVTGIPLTPAEKSGSKALQMLENLARQSIFTADDLAAYDKKVAEKGLLAVKKLASKIAGNAKGRAVKGQETIGIDIQKAVKEAVDATIDQRRSMANRDYGAISEVTGDAKVVKMTNYTNELKNIISEFSGVDGKDAESVVAQAKKLLAKNVSKPQKAKKSTLQGYGFQRAEDIPATPVSKTVKEAVGSRSYYGNAAYGKGDVFDDISKSLDRDMASRLHRALTKDLLDGELDPNVGQLFKTANDNYIKNSKSIEMIKESPLGKLLGKELDDAGEVFDAGTFNSIAGEKVIKKIMSLEPSEIRYAMKVIDDKNKVLGNEVRAHVLRDALEKSFLPPSSGMKKGSMSFNKFQSALQKSKLEAYGLTKSDIADLNDIVKTMERIGDRSGLNMSGTQEQKNMMDIAQKVASLAMGKVQAGAALAMESVGLRRIAAAMTTKEGRDALRVISKPYQNKTALDKAFNVLEKVAIGTVGSVAGESVVTEGTPRKDNTRQQWQKQKKELLDGLGKYEGSEEDIRMILMEADMKPSRIDSILKRGNRAEIENALEKAKRRTLRNK
jgi:hypothetical protein